MIIDLFTDCHLNCIFCNKETVLGYKKLGEILNYFETMKDDAVYLGGQEPLNFKDIVKLVLLLKQKNSEIKIIIKSSGYYNNKLDINFLRQIDRIELPIYSHLEVTHNRIMGNEESWAGLMGIIDLFRENDLADKLLFHTIALKENYKGIKAMYDFLINKLDNIDYFKVIYLKKNIGENIYNKIIVNQDLIIKKIIRDFPPKVLKEKIELINFQPSKEQQLFRGSY